MKSARDGGIATDGGCGNGACSCNEGGSGACSCGDGGGISGACSCGDGGDGTCSCGGGFGMCSCGGDGDGADGTCGTLGDGAVAPVDAGDGCPSGMARVTLATADGGNADGGNADGGNANGGSAIAVCVDRFEAATEVIDATGAVTPHPYDQPVDSVAKGSTIVAVVADGVKPQGYISEAQAAAACAAANKRLCTLTEWLAACQGPQGWTYPYGNTYEAGACNEGRATNPVNDCFGPGDTVFTSANMNSSCCDDQPNTVAPGGSFTRCVSSWGIYDLHGNLHEWIDAASSAGNGIFKGGFFVDAKINGAGCLYTTTAHAKTYHDYSTGFRCCATPSR
ncbi:MAG TPA: SUMF1/EgtB/PvdO family nonheme iron enzyme [Polyangia bacterium]|nr:SUMF1/EgtB/PvdO family nonheme iron enzyme [Polyangia bacterium]